MNKKLADAAKTMTSEEIEKFDSMADQWWDLKGPLKTLHDINALRITYIAERVNLKNARILDIGCGGGILSEGISKLGGDVVGIDLAQSSINVAIEHAKSNGLNIEYDCIDANDYTAINTNTFDVVTCLELLEHVDSPASVIKSCAQAVKPGGSVFFSTINRNLKSFVMAILGAEHILKMIPKGTHEYEKLIRPSELTSWCREANLHPLNLTGLHFNPLTQSYWLGGNVHVNYLAHTQLLTSS